MGGTGLGQGDHVHDSRAFSAASTPFPPLPSTAGHTGGVGREEVAHTMTVPTVSVLQQSQGGGGAERKDELHNWHPVVLAQRLWHCTQSTSTLSTSRDQEVSR